MPSALANDVGYTMRVIRQEADSMASSDRAPRFLSALPAVICALVKHGNMSTNLILVTLAGDPSSQKARLGMTTWGGLRFNLFKICA